MFNFLKFPLCISFEGIIAATPNQVNHVKRISYIFVDIRTTQKSIYQIILRIWNLSEKSSCYVVNTINEKLTEKEEWHTTARSSLEDLVRKWQKCTTHRENAVGTSVSRDLIIMKARAPCSLTTTTYHGTVITTYLPALLRSSSLPSLPLLFSYSIFTVITVLQMCQRSFLRISSQRLIIRSTNTRIQLQILTRLNRTNLFDKRSFDNNIDKNTDRQLIIK